MYNISCYSIFFFSSRRRHTRCSLVTGVQTCALPISRGVRPRSDHDEIWRFTMSKTLLAALAAAALSPVAAAAQTMSHDHDMAMPERGNDTQADESMSDMTMPGMTMPDSGYTPGSGTARLPGAEGTMHGGTHGANWHRAGAGRERDVSVEIGGRGTTDKQNT